MLVLNNRTIEVNNTDAEGRLVLGDGVSDDISYVLPHALNMAFCDSMALRLK